MAVTIDQETLGRLVARIVETVQPRRIILFGSAARGRMGMHSDVDLLVNLQTGFGLLSIVSPQEVRVDEAT